MGISSIGAAGIESEHVLEGHLAEPVTIEYKLSFWRHGARFLPPDGSWQVGKGSFAGICFLGGVVEGAVEEIGEG